MGEFNTWALVELMGHQRIAGHVSEREIAGAKLLQVDVPENGTVQSVTKFYGPSAIYCITPMTEETARAMAKQIDVGPISVWDAKRLLPSPSSEEQDEDQVDICF